MNINSYIDSFISSGNECLYDKTPAVVKKYSFNDERTQRMIKTIDKMIEVQTTILKDTYQQTRDEIN